VQTQNSIDFLDLKTARSFETLQNSAYHQKYAYRISTSVRPDNFIQIDTETHFLTTTPSWVESELYFYGEIMDAGGKNKVNIHLFAPGLGTFIINTPKEILGNYQSNLLYKLLGVRAVVRQNIVTGEIDAQSLQFKEFIDYSPVYNEGYLNGLIQRAKKHWEDVPDADAWIHEIRGIEN